MFSFWALIVVKRWLNTVQLQCVKMEAITGQISRTFAFLPIRKYAKSGKHFVEGRTKSLRRLQILGYVRNISVEKTLKGRFPERLKSFLVVYRQYLIRNSPQQRVILVKRGKTSGIVEHAQHLADNSTELPVKRQRVDAQEGKIGTVHSSAGNIGVIGDHDYTDRIENVDER